MFVKYTVKQKQMPIFALRCRYPFHVQTTNLPMCVVLDPGIGEKDSRWIGAWWLGFVVCAGCTFVWALPLLMFPSQLSSHDDSKHADKNLLSNIKGWLLFSRHAFD